MHYYKRRKVFLINEVIIYVSSLRFHLGVIIDEMLALEIRPDVQEAPLIWGENGK